MSIPKPERNRRHVWGLDKTRGLTGETLAGHPAAAGTQEGLGRNPRSRTATRRPPGRGEPNSHAFCTCPGVGSPDSPDPRCGGGACGRGRGPGLRGRGLARGVGRACGERLRCVGGRGLSAEADSPGPRLRCLLRLSRPWPRARTMIRSSASLVRTGLARSGSGLAGRLGGAASRYWTQRTGRVGELGGARRSHLFLPAPRGPGDQSGPAPKGAEVGALSN